MGKIVPIDGVPFQKQINAMLRQMFGATCTYQQLEQFYEQHEYMPFYIRKDPAYRVRRGVYRIPDDNAPQSKFGPIDADGAEVSEESSDELQMAPAPIDGDIPRPGFKHDASMSMSDIQTRLQLMADETSLMSVVPDKLAAFVPFGDYDTIKSIIGSGDFFPVFCTGLSGNGKTIFPEQACAELNREYINIDITPETDEDDLIGGFRLRNGDTYFELGPAAVAMLRGSLLVMNELDLGSPKIMCMQRVLEGKPLTIKKLGVVIKPKRGFNVYATANTKGRGDENGRFIGTGLLNEAFLERFPVTIEQQYPDVPTEEKILQKTYQSVGGVLKATPVTFFNTLAKWADGIRQTYQKGGCEDLISTRRLCHIVRAYKIFGDQDKALTYCIGRFDEKTQTSFADLYNKICPARAGQPTNVGTLNPPSGF